MVWKEGGAVVGEKSSSSRGTYMVVLDGSFEQEKKLNCEDEVGCQVMRKLEG